ncbi:hypothetical protein SAMN05428985_102682 [Nocardioides sp. YR527]|uniref:hypothetical protein n=1 Tax=Nocardioides sp. YR527 TaxID=1881028 RepID=UPI000890FCE2|nr:hypothetical protein [Nocardioides sp. YR527]SDK10393.1 hypothetical protein SAMN05428985_102682 [Nocardioides sp. YR527]
MGAAIVSGLFAVVLACLAWGLQNGSRRARVLGRIERYTRILKDIPYGHPARVHLEAALAAEAEKLSALTGARIPSYAPAPLPDPGPATMDDIFGTGEHRPITPGTPPPVQPTAPPSRPQVRRSTPPQAYASVALGLLAGGFAVVALWILIDQLLR